MIIIRPPESIYQITGSIQNGTFHGRWHFSFNGYHDPAYLSFGALEVSNINPDALFIHSEAQVFSSLLLTGQGLGYRIESGHGVYLYVVESGPLILNEEVIPEFGAARITEEPDIRFVAQRDAELLLVDVLLTEKE